MRAAPFADWISASIAASGLLAIAAFVIFVIHPGGFEGQIGWAFALMPGMPAGLILADGVYKVAPSADRIVLWSSALGITFLWYFAISYSVLKIYRLLVRAMS